MGTCYSIANSNDFTINNLNEFKEGLKGFYGGETETSFQFHYHDYKRRSKNATISVSSDDFPLALWSKENDKESICVLEYIKAHIKEEEKCTIHLVEYEHGSDMMITKIEITNTEVMETVILE